ncbi:MAG: hypothetical protein L0G99_13290 [Propionibacteriales bacterium]|nr:hypothetical protein [Propionibacteriales bacterium]
MLETPADPDAPASFDVLIAAPTELHMAFCGMDIAFIRRSKLEEGATMSAVQAV